MKKTIYILLLLCTPVFGQSPDYYDSTQLLSGSELENSLHEIIKDHHEFSYSSAKQILKQSDEDPNNNNNISLVYKGGSIPKSDFASNQQADFWNREHVWAKSHGNFQNYGDLGAYTDAHNLKPCDASINTDRGYKDFDNGGTQHSEATDCYYTSTTWEPRDEVKGDIARIIFYMHTRYSGDEGEPNLNVVDFTNTFPNAQMGKLSTLLQWNEQDPVDAFERRRNDVIYSWQNNRNPFIDYPDFANLIWGNQEQNAIQFIDVNLGNLAPNEDDYQTINAEISTNISSSVTSATLSWGTSWFELNNEVSMSNIDDIWSASIPAQSAGTDVKYKIVAQTGSLENTFYGNYNVMLNPFEGTITSIQAIQGSTDDSPYIGQTVSTTGIVTGVFGDDFFIQNGNDSRSGIYIYSSPVFPTMGDSVIVTGEVSEYYSLTEFAFPDEVYILTSNNPLPNPINITTGELGNEDYESMLVQVNDVTVTYATFNFDDYGAWRVDDGTGECIIHNTEEGYEYPATLAEQISSITGICTFNYDEWKIDLRMEDDVEGGADISGPIITEVSVIDETTLAVYFNEDVEQTSAENISNYSIDNSAVITEITRHSFQHSRVTISLESVIAGNYTLTAYNIQDVYGNETEQSSGSFEYIGIEENEHTKMNIYPNPATNIIYVEGLDKNEKIEIINILGKVELRLVTTTSTEKINLNLEKGMYYLKHKNFTKPFVIN